MLIYVHRLILTQYTYIGVHTYSFILLLNRILSLLSVSVIVVAGIISSIPFSPVFDPFPLTILNNNKRTAYLDLIIII